MEEPRGAGALMDAKGTLTMPAIELSSLRSVVHQATATTATTPCPTHSNATHSTVTTTRPGRDGQTGMDSLDEAVISRIFATLSPTDTLRLSAVSKTWHKAGQHPDVWLNMAKRLGATTHLTSREIAALRRKPADPTQRVPLRGLIAGGLAGAGSCIAGGLMLTLGTHKPSWQDYYSGNINYEQYSAANQHAQMMQLLGVVVLAGSALPALAGALAGAWIEQRAVAQVRAASARRDARQSELESIVVQSGERALEVYPVAPMANQEARPILLRLQKFTLHRHGQLQLEAREFHRAVKRRQWGTVERQVAKGVPQKEAADLLKQKHLDAAAADFAAEGMTAGLNHLIECGANPTRARNAASLLAVLPEHLTRSVSAHDADALAALGLLQELLAQHPDVQTLTRNIMTKQGHVADAKARLQDLADGHATLTTLHEAVSAHGRALQADWAHLDSNETSPSAAAYVASHAEYRLEQRGLRQAQEAYGAYAKAFSELPTKTSPTLEALAALGLVKTAFQQKVATWKGSAGLRPVANEQRPLHAAEQATARTNQQHEADNASHAAGAAPAANRRALQARAAEMQAVLDAPPSTDAPSPAVLPYPAPEAPTATFPFEEILHTLEEAQQHRQQTVAPGGAALGWRSARHFSPDQRQVRCTKAGGRLEPSGRRRGLGDCSRHPDLGHCVAV